MTDDFQTNLSGTFVPVQDPTKIMLRGRGKAFDAFRQGLESLNRPDLKVTIVETGRKA